jgi:hypothetical protein
MSGSLASSILPVLVDGSCFSTSSHGERFHLRVPRSYCDAQIASGDPPDLDEPDR